jgi:hypothetical protein
MNHQFGHERGGDRMADFPSYFIVSAADARQVPYPFVYVNADGTVRELHVTERRYLETSFHPCDSGRPYTKQSYAAKDGWGELSGFCARSMIPAHLAVSPAPDEDPDERWGAMMRALDAHRDHPSYRRFERIVHSTIAGDGAGCDPGLRPRYRFSRDKFVADVWELHGVWFVRPWQRMRARGSHTVKPVADLGAALDELERL